MTGAQGHRLRHRLRLLAAALIACGALGMVTLALATAFAAAPLQQVGSLGQAFAAQRAALVTALAKTSGALDDAATSAANFHASLTDARAATGSAAALSRQLATTLAGLGAAAGIDVFGARPFGQLQAGFQQAATQLRGLGTQLDGIGTALARNGADLDRERQNLAAMRDSVEALQSGVSDTVLPSFSAGAVTAMQIALSLLVLWLAILALGALAAGVLLWRATGPPGVAGSRSGRRGPPGAGHGGGAP